MTVDKEATISNVRRFFDSGLESLLRKANCNHSDLKSPSFDGMPKAPTKGNVAEDKMMVIETAREHILCVRLAIKKSEYPTRDVLNKCFVDKESNFVVTNEMSISERQLLRLKNIALLEFADRYHITGLLYGFTDTDLHVYVDDGG